MTRLPVIYSASADRDLEKILEYIARKSSTEIAEAYVERLREECDSLSWSAARGMEIRYRGGRARRFGFERSATILYRRDFRRVFIVAVKYRGINLPRYR